MINHGFLEFVSNKILVHSPFLRRSRFDPFLDEFNLAIIPDSIYLVLDNNLC